MELYQKLLIAILALLISLYIKFCLKRRRFYKVVDKIPGTKRFPIPGLEGLITAIKFAGKDNKEIFEYLLELSRGKIGPSKIWLLNKCYVVIEDPKNCQVVFNSSNSLEKADIQKTLPVQKGLICSGLEYWRPHRKYLSPAFKPSILRSFHPNTNRKAKKVVDLLTKRVERGEINIYKPMIACTCEAILDAMLGMQVDYINDENNKYLRYCSLGQELLGQKILKLWLNFKPILMMTKYYKIEQELILGKDGVLAMADTIMEANQYRKKEETNDDTEEDEDETRKKKVLIDYFVANKLNWTKDEIKDELNTVLLAGFDTTALTLSGCILMLAMHPNFQNKVVEELRQVFQTEDEEVTEEHLKQLVYLEYVINETLRLFPVVPMQTRQTTGDVELEDFTLPEGVQILLPQFTTHRNKEYWGEDAHLFNPDRFYPDQISNIHPYAFTPFAQGPRICLGMRYGMAVMKTVLSYFFRKYKVKTQLKYDEIEFEFYMTIKIKQNYMVELENRKF